MALAPASSLPVASILAVLTFSLMQMAKSYLAATQSMTILGGLMGSILYVFILTALGNLEQVIFGKGFQTKLPETVFSLALALFAAGSVHRVCVTTCLLFSLVMTYSMYQISQQEYDHDHTQHKQADKPKKKK